MYDHKQMSTMINNVRYKVIDNSIKHIIIMQWINIQNTLDAYITPKCVFSPDCVRHLFY